MKAQQERRQLPRLAIHLPAEIILRGASVHHIHTETRNVNARGVFFYMDRVFLDMNRKPPGSSIEFILTFPPELTHTQALRVGYKGTVVRLEQSASDRVGVAAAIESYEFLTDPIDLPFPISARS